MSEAMAAVLVTLPDDLRPAATRLWEQSRSVSDEVTETLMYCFKVLCQIPGRPADLDSGADLLDVSVAEELDDARADIDDLYPAVTEAWVGGGADTFSRFVPRLTDSIRALRDSVTDTVSAITAFRHSLASLWRKVVEKTRQTGDEVTVAVAAVDSQQFLAVAPVIDIVERYADYVEELAESLMNLSGESHEAGMILARAALTPAGLVGDPQGGYRLPRLSDMPVEAEWRPSHSEISMDIRAMANLTSALSGSGQYWQAAAGNISQAATVHLTPEAFGIAGAHFQPDVQEVMARDRDVYLTADADLDALAHTLRLVGREYATVDDEVGRELRRGLDED